MRNGSADDLTEGLAILQREWAMKAPYDLVILDLMKPGAEGIEMLRRIKSAPNLTAAKVILLTPYDLPEQKAEALEAGVDGYLIKPIKQSQLFDSIRRGDEQSDGCGFTRRNAGRGRGHGFPDRGRRACFLQGAAD